MQVHPAPEPSKIEAGRGWRVECDDGIVHDVDLDRDLHKGTVFVVCDGAMFALGFPGCVILFPAGVHRATVAVDAVREPMRAYLRRFLRRGPLLVLLITLPFLRQEAGVAYGASAGIPKRLYLYSLWIDDRLGGTWVAVCPNGVVRGWLFLGPDAGPAGFAALFAACGVEPPGPPAPGPRWAGP